MTTKMERFPEVIATSMMAIPGDSISRHWEELVDGDAATPVSLSCCIEMFDRSSDLMKAMGERRSIIWVIALSETDSINLGGDIDPDRIRVPLREIAIYCFEGAQFLEDVFEDYRKRITVRGSGKIDALYRSWQSESAMRNGWGFSNDVYLWKRAAANADIAPIR